MAHNDKDNDNLKTDIYIDRYLDGLFSKDEKNKFETRCLEDSVFFKRVRQRELLRDKVTRAIKKEGEEIFSDDFKIRKKVVKKIIVGQVSVIWHNVKPVWKYSLIPVVALAVTMLFVLLPSGNSFNKNKALEQKLGQQKNNIRSLAEDFKIISPQINERVNLPIHFKWQTEANGPFTLIILDTKGLEVKEILVDTKEFSFDEPLRDGLYYWKLLDKEYWIYTGKFRKSDE